MFSRASHRWLAWVVAVFALHFAWEMAQANWFASMRGLTFWRATFLCLRAALGDLAITAVAFSIAAGLARTITWPVASRVLVPAVIFVAVGIAITIGYEVFATTTGRWRYDERMPTLFGIGVTPLLQWLILPSLELLFFRLLWRPRGKTC